MEPHTFLKRFPPLLFLGILPAIPAAAQQAAPSNFSFASGEALTWMLLIFMLAMLFAVLVLKQKVSNARNSYKKKNAGEQARQLEEHTRHLNSEQIGKLIELKKHCGRATAILLLLFTAALSVMPAGSLLAQNAGAPAKSSLLSETGILITIVLLVLPILAAIIILIAKVMNTLDQARNQRNLEEAGKLAAHLRALPEEMIDTELRKRKAALDYKLSHRELSGTQTAADEKGLLHLNGETGLPIVALKKKALPRPNIDPALSRLICWYLGFAAFWLLFGTTVGEYVGIKFVAPDADHVSWLSFGRLRPVHTNAVFWGWASLGMLGLGYYVVPRVSNTKLANIRYGWYALGLINAAVVLGTVCLMAGVNNGGGEYREYIWPVMVLFAAGIVFTLVSFLRTIARRATKEIYISNWYIVASIIFAIVITVVAYVPYWQNGLGETIVQGYYMHQGVGMWFMLFTLGIVYYFLPQQLNKPIYSYSLGILAFWTQILFYTLIGTHHFVFSSIPWWLQTVAIVGSAGMAIPVIAGTTNFLMTFKGAWYKVKDSYTLPFFLVGIVFYFTGSMQGTAEAFRNTNLIWHFTDFTVAHSHLTMYGIICFFLWAGIYAIVPRLTGKEAPQITIGAHFWLALIGLMFYTVPLMYGSTLKGLMWIEGKPFIESVVMMAPYWLWRAIGGSLMWLSHLFFAYNMYKMMTNTYVVDVRETAIQKLHDSTVPAQPIV
ncbi:cbb3-type cytochrome c oxidase subunit I [Chitinophaga sp. GCM10012297]|uniref:Cbb3-type cytochrome c oxidase subunit I n=1 Tax=Chitinophaga chungangae TaxID=2821488 RepID=A0ABS3YHF6_9BACT|nr:cbb3-type cytochrome c oxidase subunit I [Chitinophaga chungangae]MBO9154124.1 cbb3-type cytochrome c oxidase subunit I [Chitinophaga chungangae]